MPRVAPLQANFNSGEVSSLVYGRADAARYKQAVARCLNYLPVIQGPLTRRPGSYYIADAKFNATPARLAKFKFSTVLSYVLEFGELYVRFYRSDGQILSGGIPYEIATPYAAADVAELTFVQKANVIYVLHPQYAPIKLLRAGDTSWSYQTVTFLDGPYLPTNTTAITVTPSAASGAITLTASSGIFASTDVGRLFRIRESTTWTDCRITAFTSSTVVSALVLGTGMPATGAVTTWRLGLWSVTTGYPAAGCFHEDRLVLVGGNTALPQRIDFSNSGDYENFAPSAADGTIVDSNAIGANLNSDDVNEVFWVVSDEKGLLAGTSAGEWAVTSVGGVLTPTDIGAKQATRYGSARVQPEQVGKSTFFIQEGGRKAREMGYDFNVSGFRCPDRTLLSEHITGLQGIKYLAYQKTPHSVLWAVRNDGVLATMTYDYEDNNLVIGWARQIIGNYSGDGLIGVGEQAVVESIAVIPSDDGSNEEEVWLLVNRQAGNPFGPDLGNNRTIEVLTKFFEDGDDPRDAFFVDCGLTYNSPLSVTGITYDPAYTLITSVAHGFSNGDTVLLEDLGSTNSQLEGFKGVINSVTADTFRVAGGFSGSYLYPGVVRKCVSVLGGLDHLEGSLVDILADGALQPPKQVISGQVSISFKASRIHVGLNIVAQMQQLRLEAGAADGTSFGKTRRANRIGVMLRNTGGMKFGYDFEELDEMIFRTTGDEVGQAVPLFSGIQSEEAGAGYDMDNRLCLEQSVPLPGTILAIMPQMETQDRS